MITKKECKAKSVQGGITGTFEYGLWELTSGKSNIMLLGIYHPPPSKRNEHTNENFIDEFLELFMDLSMKYMNLLIIRNFNIHCYHDDDIRCEQLQDSMVAMGLMQHLNFVTNTSGTSVVEGLSDKSKFKDCTNNNYSDETDVFFSVPQGSINRSVLFN